MLKTDISLVLLAGGEGSRMKNLTSTTPKPLLPIYNESLLQRHIRHAKDAKIEKIIVSAKPEWINIFTRHLNMAGLGKNVIVFPNPYHMLGSLPALLSVIEEFKSDYFLMSLSDIFFFDNPYISFANSTNNLCIFGISEPFDLQELSRGGIVFVADNKIQSIKERPLKNNKKGYRWSGLSLFSRELALSLSHFLEGYPKYSPEGDFFEFWRSKEGMITPKRCPDFINVNTPDQLFLASLYNFSIISGNKSIKHLADTLRKNALYSNKPS